MTSWNELELKSYLLNDLPAISKNTKLLYAACKLQEALGDLQLLARATALIFKTEMGKVEVR